VRDIEQQLSSVERLVLFCPVRDSEATDSRSASDEATIPSGVEIVDSACCTGLELRAFIARCDLIQIPGNFSWRESAVIRTYTRLASAQNKPVVLGISSNRARTSVMNSAGAGLLRRSRAKLRSVSIRASQTYLARRCKGVFVVGEGLRGLVEPWNRNVHVGVASWVQQADIRPSRPAMSPGSPITLCAAGRLEPMKGIHIAVDALSRLVSANPGRELRLEIAGVGGEEPSLRTRVASLGREDRVAFKGSLAYPDAFFNWLLSIDIVLLTNLNDEQPRLVFDALSQGCLPVCPDSPPYRALGIPAALLYRQGSADSLAECVSRLIDSPEPEGLRNELRALAQRRTLESMHSLRAEWIETSVLSKKPPIHVASSRANP
jgi:glycosyltransferase involved in cell wall biosynthesis